MNSERLAYLTNLYSDVKGEPDFERFLTDYDLDAVAVATPVAHHHAMATAALAAGKHTFVEKPLAASSEECEELVDLAREKGVVLMVGHTFLYSVPVRKAKEIIDSGDIGDIRYISSRRLNLGLFQKDINVVWDLAPHDISIAMFLMGEAPRAVNCQGKANVTPGIEDVSNLTLHFPRGGYATIQNSWLDPKKIREMTIVGSKKMIVYDDVEPLQKIKIFDTRVVTPPHYDTYAEFQYSYHYGDMHVPYLKQEETLQVECRHFIECINSGANPLTSGEQGHQLVRVLEAASKSLSLRGMEVDVESGAPIDMEKIGRRVTDRTNGVNRAKITRLANVASDVKLGKGVKIHDFANLYGCEIGDETKVGTLVEIQKGVKIGKRCKISSHSFICEGVIIEDNAFVGHNVTFINDRYPKSTNDDGSMQADEDWKCEATVVKTGASIGSSATLMCGITVGENAIVGAGSVVTKDVPANTVVAGNPCRVIREADAQDRPNNANS